MNEESKTTKTDEEVHAMVDSIVNQDIVDELRQQASLCKRDFKMMMADMLERAADEIDELRIEVNLAAQS
jgi:hypothetical protein